MSKSNENVVHFFNNFSKQVNGKEIAHILNPFFNFFPSGFVSLENHCITQSKYNDPYSISYSWYYSVACLIKNVISLVKRFSNRIYLFFSNPIMNKSVHGKIHEDTEVLLYTWIYHRDLDKHLTETYDYIWNEFYKELSDYSRKYQVIAVPLFTPTPAELELLLKHGRIVVLPFRFHCKTAIEYVFNLCMTLSKALFSLRRLDWFISYFSTLMNIRGISALEIYHDVSRIITREHIVLIPWESQPEQKALCRAFREKGSRVYGYIHSGTTNIHCFVQKIADYRFNDAFPSRIFTHSIDTVDALQEVGWERGEINIIKTIRYNRRKPEDFHGKMYLPYAFDLSKRALLNVDSLVKDGLFKISDIVLHPQLKENKKLNRLKNSIPLVADSTDVVVVGFSTVILEALEVGCHVIQIVFDKIGDFDNTAYPSIKKTRINDYCYMLSGNRVDQNHLIAYTYPEKLIDFIAKESVHS